MPHEPLVAGAPEQDPPADRALYSLTRHVLRPDASSDTLLIIADALDEAAEHLQAPEAAAYRREARFLREAAPRYAPSPSFVVREMGR